jgi:hypothetical protein
LYFFIIKNLIENYVLGILEKGKQRNVQIKNDAFIPSHEFESEILFRLKIISTTLSDIISDLIVYGEKIQEYRQKEGKLPRSYIYKLGTFLKFWMTVEMNQYN